MHPKIRRGYVKSDERDFAPGQVRQLQKAQKDILYLIDGGYDLKHSVTFVGDRFQFSARQRTALTRATAKTENKLRREKKCLQLVQGQMLYIDGFNLIIALEAALSPDTTIFRGMDGAIRDLCGLRGTYRLIESTTRALQMIGAFLAEAKVKHAVFYLDAPVSNSGRLKTEIYEIMTQYAVSAAVEMVPNADAKLWDRECVVSSDGIILDRCISWINLAAAIIAETLPERRIVDLSNAY